MRIICLSIFLALSIQAAEVHVYFSPKGDCTEAVVEAINHSCQRRAENGVSPPV